MLVSAIRYYLPWDTTLSFNLNTKASRNIIGHELARVIPPTLLLQKIQTQTSEFHKPIVVISDSFTLEQQIIAREFFSQDTVTTTMRSVRERDLVLASIRIRGWLPISISIIPEQNDKCKSDFVVLPLQLQPGLNTILFEITGKDKKLLLRDTLSLQYDFELSGGLKDSGFVTEHFHETEKERQCSSCHRDEKTKALNCISCHGAMIQQKAVHGPVATKDCGKCHESDPATGYTVKYKPEDEQKNCFTCHADVAADTKNKSLIHGPFGGGRCNFCHSPHASPVTYQLRKPVNELCNSCHSDKQEHNHPVVYHPVGNKPDPRSPEKEISCTSCHVSHTSENNNLLAMPGGYFALCQSCHKK